MSRENVELVRKATDAFNRRDFDMLEELADDDLEFVSVLTAVDGSAATYRGAQTWARYFEAMDETWTDWRAEDLQLFDGGDDRVAATFRIVGTGRHSKVSVDRRVGLAYRVREGRLWRVRSYLEPSDALDAAGLS